MGAEEKSFQCTEMREMRETRCVSRNIRPQIPLFPHENTQFPEGRTCTGNCCHNLRYTSVDAVKQIDPFVLQKKTEISTQECFRELQELFNVRHSMRKFLWTDSRRNSLYYLNEDIVLLIVAILSWETRACGCCRSESCCWWKGIWKLNHLISMSSKACHQKQAEEDGINYINIYLLRVFNTHALSPTYYYDANLPVNCQ